MSNTHSRRDFNSPEVHDNPESLRDTASFWNDRRPVEFITITRGQYEAAIRDAKADALDKAADRWPLRRDSGFNTEWLRNRAAAIRDGGDV